MTDWGQNTTVCVPNYKIFVPRITQVITPRVFSYEVKDTGSIPVGIFMVLKLLSTTQVTHEKRKHFYHKISLFKNMYHPACLPRAF